MNPEFAAALVKAQTAVTNVVKDAENPHFKSAYASLAAVRDSVFPAFNGAGIAIMQTPHTSDEGAVSVETILVHESGETIEYPGPAVAPGKPDAQGVGSCITYLRRYNLLAVAGIAPEDDDGNAASVSGTAAGRKVSARRATPSSNGASDSPSAEWLRNSITIVQGVESVDKLADWWRTNRAHIAALPKEDAASLTAAKDNRKTELESPNVR